ncbi:conserved protein of unknown function [Clostridium beijerinckii]|nr:conserved protein of unknown function [Clostridium beijerinckii]
MKILNLPFYLFDINTMFIQNNDKITIYVIIKNENELILDKVKLLFMEI